MMAELLDLNLSKNQVFKLRHIDGHLRLVLKACGDSYVHSEARELVPVSQLVQDNLDILDNEANYLDNLLPFVVDWFKKDFFKWFKPPSCEKCSIKLVCRGSSCSIEGKVVEHYHCTTQGCDIKFEFVRHNEPAILLRTRTGRCGEWAICFLIILRSLDYDARIVYDSTDHVWNEIWSEPKQRWVHVDPCEGVVDEPLLYEIGWQKKLEYCLGVSQYEILDVTRRYTVDYSAIRRRRNQCDEVWLENCLNEVTENLLKSVSSGEVRSRVRNRRQNDVEYMEKLTREPQVVPDRIRYSGRKTGSIQWRIERGEYVVSKKSEHIIVVKPCKSLYPDHVVFSLTYNCDHDLYESSVASYNTKGWSSLIYEYENLDYTYEEDWDTSYVARYETCPPSRVGKVRWRFDLTAMENNWQRLELVVKGKEYRDTYVRIELKSYEDCNSKALDTQLFPLNEPLTISKEQLAPKTKFVDVFVILSGGDEEDSSAWQRPQLFRQTRGRNEHESALSVKFYSSP